MHKLARMRLFVLALASATVAQPAATVALATAAALTATTVTTPQPASTVAAAVAATSFAAA